MLLLLYSLVWMYVEMRQRPFLKTFCKENVFLLRMWFGIILAKSWNLKWFFIFECAPCRFCMPSWLFGVFLEIDCINLKNLKAELATIIHSSISGLVSLCYLPTRPLGTVRWGSQKTRFRTIERVKKVVSTSEHLYWLMLESLDLFYPFFRRIRDQKRLGQP